MWSWSPSALYFGGFLRLSNPVVFIIKLKWWVGMGTRVSSLSQHAEYAKNEGNAEIEVEKKVKRTLFLRKKWQHHFKNQEFIFQKKQYWGQKVNLYPLFFYVPMRVWYVHVKVRHQSKFIRYLGQVLGDISPHLVTWRMISPSREPTNSHKIGLQNKFCFHVRRLVSILR